MIGNCGVGIAPCRPQAHEVAMRDLVKGRSDPVRGSGQMA